MSHILYDFAARPLFIGGFRYSLGSVRRSLPELQQLGLLASRIEDLAKSGYAFNYAAASHTTLIELAAQAFGKVVEEFGKPAALVVHHSYAENAAERCLRDCSELLAHGSFFPATLLRHLHLDEVPYFGSFGTGCIGLISLLGSAGSLLATSTVPSVVCVTADLKPQAACFDSLRSRILTSDVASAFLATREPMGYQVLGLSLYSSSREVIPLVEIVKRSVEMIKELCQQANVSCKGDELVCHYPNMFLETWRMVSHFLKIPKDRHLVDDCAERAHCLSTDPVITLAKQHQGRSGRLHAVFNFGTGLHLGVGLFREV